jgi:DNA-directed RNA polymerase specialized sigma24 family protein
MTSDDIGLRLTPGAGQFATTHWSVVLAAARGDCSQAMQALETLCESYWYPLYAFVRRCGYGPEDAEDLTQAFFARFLAKAWLEQADQAKGRFRSFLLGSLKHFLANEWDRAHAQKRGGNATHLSFDGAAAEHRYSEEPATKVSPDLLYEQRWACVLLERVMEHLAQDYHVGGKGELFQALEPLLAGDKDSSTYAQLAARFGLTEAAVKMKVQRLRHRFQSLLRQEIGNTVACPEEVEDELRFLFRVLSG